MKALGIVSLVFSALAFVIPIVGVYLTVVTGILAVFALGPGYIFGLIAIGLNIGNLTLFSPLLWVAMSADASGEAAGTGIFLVGLQIGSLLLLIFRNKKLKASESTS
jgi:hypothetical protein